VVGIQPSGLDGGFSVRVRFCVCFALVTNSLAMSRYVEDN
jgi:hypothetical protein